jgi:hypothetical protein
MTPDDQRIAIAEACGWTISTNPAFGWLKNSEWVGEVARPLPDYLNDLNAMHEAEKAFSVRQAQMYIVILRNLCVVAGCWPETATAAQRAEAFLRTVEKWKD